MRDKLELRQKVTDIIREGYLNDAKAVVIMDDILSLIDAERCVWTSEGEGWRTECGSYFLTRANFCPCCGKKIEVKEG